MLYQPTMTTTTNSYDGYRCPMTGLTQAEEENLCSTCGSTAVTGYCGGRGYCDRHFDAALDSWHRDNGSVWLKYEGSFDGRWVSDRLCVRPEQLDAERERFESQGFTTTVEAY